MRLRLETTERSPFWLVGDPAHNYRTEGSEAMNEDLQISRNQQALSGAEWDGQLFFDRKNQKVSITATGWRFFATEVERMEFIASLVPESQSDLAHLWEGTVYVRLDTADGYKEWPLRGAVVSLVGTKLEGEGGIYLNYRINAPGMGQVITSLLTLPLFRCNIVTAQVGMTVDEMNTVATAESLTTGDWLQFVLVNQAGEEFVSTLTIGDYGLVLPFVLGSLALIEASLDVDFALAGYEPGYEVTGDAFTLTASGAGAQCYAAVRFGSGSTVLHEITAEGNEDQLPIQLRDSDLTMTMEVIV